MVGGLVGWERENGEEFGRSDDQRLLILKSLVYNYVTTFLRLGGYYGKCNVRTCNKRVWVCESR